jgi:hypothetical protein
LLQKWPQKAPQEKKFDMRSSSENRFSKLLKRQQGAGTFSLYLLLNMATSENIDTTTLVSDGKRNEKISQMYQKWWGEYHNDEYALRLARRCFSACVWEALAQSEDHNALAPRIYPFREIQSITNLIHQKGPGAVSLENMRKTARTLCDAIQTKALIEGGLSFCSPEKIVLRTETREPTCSPSH